MCRFGPYRFHLKCGAASSCAQIGALLLSFDMWCCLLLCADWGPIAFVRNVVLPLVVCRLGPYCFRSKCSPASCCAQIWAIPGSGRKARDGQAQYAGKGGAAPHLLCCLMHQGLVTWDLQVCVLYMCVCCVRCIIKYVVPQAV